MLIHVVYHDQKHDFIKDTRLDEFIEAGKIAMFLRSDGWVRVGVDPVRAKTTNSPYKGSERRQSQD
jgi:hypothetical protein